MEKYFTKVEKLKKMIASYAESDIVVAFSGGAGQKSVAFNKMSNNTI